MRLFTTKLTAVFVLKSGKEVAIRADDVKITKSGNNLTGYTIEGGDGTMFYCRLDEIAAILLKK